MRLTPIVIFLLLVALLGAMLMRQSQVRDEMVATPNSHLPLLTLHAFEGSGSWSEKTVLGHVTVINFFASWCAPCAKEMPELVALKKQFPSVQFEGLVWNDDPATIRPFLKNNGNPFDRLWMDRSGNAAITLGLRGVPETFIIDATGTVRLRMAGAISRDMRQGKLSELLVTLVDEAKGAK
jgi:cytochrome c biogenesis protein CcmG/thiol:disulfide interchange protein DsbE